MKSSEVAEDADGRLSIGSLYAQKTPFEVSSSSTSSSKSLMFFFALGVLLRAIPVSLFGVFSSLAFLFPGCTPGFRLVVVSLFLIPFMIPLFFIRGFMFLSGGSFLGLIGVFVLILSYVIIRTARFVLPALIG